MTPSANVSAIAQTARTGSCTSGSGVPGGWICVSALIALSSLVLGCTYQQVRPAPVEATYTFEVNGKPMQKIRVVYEYPEKYDREADPAAGSLTKPRSDDE